MKDLIAKLEAAEGPSRALDAEIAVAARVASNITPQWWLGFPSWRACPDGLVDAVHTDGSVAAWVSAPHFSSSIDAAMKLVPEGWGARLSVVGNLCHVTLVRQGAEYSCAHIGSLAIALCIAALKAREASND